MKTLLIALWLFVSEVALAQTPRTDVLYKLDQTTINVKIDELTDTDVLYFESTAPTVKKTIARSQVWKIVFRDGSTEVITPQLGQTASVSEEGLRKTRQPSVANQTPITTPTRVPTDNLSAPSATASYKDPQAFSRIHLTIGPEFSYYPDALNKDKVWLNDSTGFGMKQNIGASLRFDYLLFRRLGISLTSGYYGWELVRRYTRDGAEEYTETKRLTQIPVQLGLKLYPFGSFYVMPEAGLKLFFSSFKTSDTHPDPTNETVNAAPITYGGSIGYEIRQKSFLIDLSLRYQILNVKNFHSPDFTISESLNIVSLRVGIGFNSFKK